MKQKIVILGGGGTGLLMAETVARCGNLQLVGFLDDDTLKQSSGYRGYPVLGPLSYWKELPDDICLLSSLYGAKKNAAFAETIEALGIPQDRWATVVDPTAIISPSAGIAEGAYVGPASVVEPAVEIGPQSALLGNVYVAHDTRIGRYVCCANSASLSGEVKIADASFVGANSCVREYTTVGQKAIIAMGSVVIRDVAPETTVAGNPAREIHNRGD